METNKKFIVLLLLLIVGSSCEKDDTSEKFGYEDLIIGSWLRINPEGIERNNNPSLIGTYQLTSYVYTFNSDSTGSTDIRTIQVSHLSGIDTFLTNNFQFNYDIDQDTIYFVPTSWYFKDPPMHPYNQSYKLDDSILVLDLEHTYHFFINDKYFDSTLEPAITPLPET